jgi:hypothetical protein
MGRVDPVGRHAAHRDQGVHAPRLRAGRGREDVLADGPRVQAARRRHGGPREHPGDARREAARAASRSSATTPPAYRASRWTQASSTRCGPT